MIDLPITLIGEVCGQRRPLVMRSFSGALAVDLRQDPVRRHARPDFDRRHRWQALEAYTQRKRRFGGLR
jgi:hypothetical protein